MKDWIEFVRKTVVLVTHPSDESVRLGDEKTDQELLMIATERETGWMMNFYPNKQVLVVNNEQGSVTSDMFGSLDIKTIQTYNNSEQAWEDQLQSLIQTTFLAMKNQQNMILKQREDYKGQVLQLDEHNTIPTYPSTEQFCDVVLQYCPDAQVSIQDITTIDYNGYLQAFVSLAEEVNSQLKSKGVENPVLDMLCLGKMYLFPDSKQKQLKKLFKLNKVNHG